MSTPTPAVTRLTRHLLAAVSAVRRSDFWWGFTHPGEAIRYILSPRR